MKGSSMYRKINQFQKAIVPAVDPFGQGGVRLAVVGSRRGAFGVESKYDLDSAEWACLRTRNIQQWCWLDHLWPVYN